MPYASVPNRGDLNMFYIINPAILPHQVTSTEPPESQPLDFAKHTIIFLHGGTASSSSFKAQMVDARLAGQYNLVFLDMRFHGRTTGAERTSHTLHDSSECVISVIDQLQIPSYSLFGEAIQGAVAATWVAIHRPDKTRSLMLASPGWMKEKPELHDMLLQVIPIMAMNKDGQGDGTGQINEDGLIIVGNYFIGDDERVREQRIAAQAEFEQRYGRGHTNHDLEHIVLSGANREPIPKELLAVIKVPVLILHGTNDKIVSPLAACEEWRDSFKSAKGGAVLHEIAGGFHRLSCTDFSIVNRMLAQFTARSLAK